MIAHLVKLAWNRRRANALTIVEVAASFVVLFAVATMATAYVDNWRHPLGFDAERVVNVVVDVKQETDDTFTPEQVERTRALARAALELPEVEASAVAFAVPYQFWSSNGVHTANGLELEFERDEVTDDFAEVFRLDLVRGRWFSREDDAAQIPPVVLNRRFAEALFGDEDPVGQILVGSDPGDAARVVGVVSDFRKGGELSLPGNFRFERANLNDPTLRPPRNIAVRVRPGTTAEFEEKLASTLQATVRDWSYDVQPIAELREEANQVRLMPLAIGGLVASSLLAMVALGITGVIWQSVTRRTMELGLRRVQGATARDVFVQILGELLVVTTVAVAAGLLVVLQVPLLELVSYVSARVYTIAVAVSVGLVYGLALVAGLYPSWLATRVQPVDALRYE